MKNASSLYFHSPDIWKSFEGDPAKYAIYKDLLPEISNSKVDKIAQGVIEQTKSDVSASAASLAPTKIKPIKKRRLQDFASKGVIKKTSCKTPTKKSSYKKIEAFFSNREPKKWYHLQYSKEKESITISLPNYCKKLKKLIYIFKNKKTKRCLIGKTGSSFQQRISNYITKFNKPGSEHSAKKENTKDFLNDVKRNPNHFEVGILYVLNKNQDIDYFEKQFIKFKRNSSPLYNDNVGGGGGLAHTEELATQYAILDPKKTPFTPEKYYSLSKDKMGNIRPKLSPGFRKKIKSMQQEFSHRQYLYVFKHLKKGRRYIGMTGRQQPSVRWNEHCYRAQKYDPKHANYDPAFKATDKSLHSEIAKNPQAFGCALMPVQIADKINSRKRKNYLSFEGGNSIEKFTIAFKKTLVNQKGYNRNEGGGGPVARRVTRFAKKLDY